MLYIIFVLILGLLTAKRKILEKVPNLSGIVEAVTPFQAWIGVVGFINGIIILIKVISFSGFLETPVLWFAYLANGVFCFFAGFLMGFPILDEYILKGRGDDIKAKVVPHQTNIGLGCIAVAIFWVLTNFIIY